MPGSMEFALRVRQLMLFIRRLQAGGPVSTDKKEKKDVLYTPTQPNVKQVKDAQFVVVESDPPKLMVRIRDSMYEITGLTKA